MHACMHACISLAAEHSRLVAEQSVERDDNLKQMKILEDEIRSLEREATELKDNDPDVVAKMTFDTDIRRRAANRWLDNIYEVRSWLMKKRGLSSREVGDHPMIMISYFLIAISLIMSR